jgi:hypothetical protein
MKRSLPSLLIAVSLIATRPCWADDSSSSTLTGPQELPAHKARDSRLPAYVLGGIGLVGIGLGSTMGFLTLNEKGEAEDHCSDSQRLCDEQGAQANDKGRTYAAISLASLIMGSALLTTSVWLFSSHKRRTSVSTSFSPRAVRFTLKAEF